ncbi:MAG: hypothetical protein OJF59_002233 [Cytophagales bacterium]|nr:MAG: hypothetical protein OJF59_002233 [Cytophagales bacterium]
MRLVKAIFFAGSIFLFLACASSHGSGYKPKYKKPNWNKPLPCPLKDC